MILVFVRWRTTKSVWLIYIATEDLGVAQSASGWRSAVATEPQRDTRFEIDPTEHRAFVNDETDGGGHKYDLEEVDVETPSIFFSLAALLSEDEMK